MKKLFILFFIFISSLCFAQSWKSVGGGTNLYGGVSIIFNDTVNNLLYAGGSFDTIGGVAANKIAKWDGTKWYSLNSPNFSFVPNTITIWHNDVYVGSHTSTKVYKYDGATWTTMPKFDGYVWVLKVIRDTLYAGGAFSSSGGILMNGIAKWNGTKWMRVGDTLGMVNGCALCMTVNDIELYRDTLVIAGDFPIGADSVLGNIAKWDGTKWRSLGIGTLPPPFNTDNHYGAIMDILPIGDTLIVGGPFFDYAGGNPAKRIALWDGNSWHNMGAGLNEIDTYNCIKLFKNKIVVTDYSGPHEWKGNNWVVFGDSLSGNFITSEVFNNELYVGGGGADLRQYYHNIARWSPLQKEGQSATCSDTCNGFASVTPLGGLAPYTYQWNTSPMQTTSTIAGLCAGTYSVSVTDVSGSPTTGEIIIISPSSIQITDTVTNATCATCADGSASVKVSGGVSPYTFSWDNGNTTDTIKNQLPGTYILTVTDSNGCVATDTALIDFDTHTLNLSPFTFNLFPNPVSEQLTVICKHLESEIEIKDLPGRNIYQQTITSKQTIINVSRLPAGIYFAVFSNEDGSKAVKKFVKE